MMVDSLTSAMPQIQAGKLRALAISGAARSTALPDVPTCIEAGRKGFIPPTSYQGLWGPAGMPAAVVQRLNAESNKALQSAELREHLAKYGVEPIGGPAETFAATVRRDIDRWSEVIKRGGIKAE
jgi:tripartite-type tricarboxylate transporter receptor subunit TctC